MQIQKQSTGIKDLVAVLVQNNPKLLQKTNNINTCRKMLNDDRSWAGVEVMAKNAIDIIAFPQMSFTGYNFQNYQHILPMACFAGEGQDFQFARQTALKFNSYVIFGYVQKVLNTKSKENNQNQNNQKNSQTLDLAKQNQSSHQFVLYNSASILDRNGKLVLNTRKSHLYFCDQLWSEQGDGFKYVDIINSKGQSIKCAVGICMDINEKNFSSGKNQLADFIIKNQCQCLLFISNWTDSSPSTNQEAQLFRMLNYWLHRLGPLLQDKQSQRLFLICDRVGFQYNYYDKKQSWFFGCSGGLNLNPPQVYHVLDKREQKCILISGKIPSVKQNK